MNKPLLRFVRHSQIIGMMFSIITLIGVLSLAFSKKLASTVPYNYYILAGTTFSTAWTMSYFCAFFDPEIVAQAALLTGASVGGLTYYAWNSEGRFNYRKASLYASGAILLVQLTSMFLFRPNLTNLVLSVLFGISSMFSILFQTEAIIGKKNVKYTKDDYICAAMNLYIEIGQLFMELVKILNALSGEDKKKDKKKKRDD